MAGRGPRSSAADREANGNAKRFPGRPTGAALGCVQGEGGAKTESTVAGLSPCEAGLRGKTTGPEAP